MYLALEAECGCFIKIMDAKYEKVVPQKAVQQQLHLTEKQREELVEMLLKQESLFDSTLGKCPHKKIHLELLEGAKSVHQKA
jgi:hypothetical protein